MEKIEINYTYDDLEGDGTSENFKTTIKLSGLDESNKLMRLITESYKFITLLGFDYENIKEFSNVYLDTLFTELESSQLKLEKDKEVPEKEVKGFNLDS